MGLKVKTYDIILLVIPVLLMAVGIAVIYSLIFGTGESNLVVKQGVSALIGIAVMILISFFDYRFFRGTNWIFYIITILLLIYVDFFGIAAGGAMRWIDFGFFQLQPSEIAKAFLILTLSSFYCSRIGKLKWSDIFLSLLIMAPPIFLILKEPDLGTALVICFIFIVILFFSKPNKLQAIVISSLVIGFAAILVLAALNVGPFGRVLHDYQRNRILTFVDPNLDPYGKGYNVRQAQITIGSGGIMGKGLGRGTQSQLQFLPKAHTDFIFAGIAESFGFFGTAIFLGLLAYLIIEIVSIAHIARDNFGLLVGYGTAAMLLFQVVVNVGMNLGLAPVTGIPLPFASSGGSALIAYLFLIGIVQSIFIRHKKITF